MVRTAIVEPEFDAIDHQAVGCARNNARGKRTIGVTRAGEASCRFAACDADHISELCRCADMIDMTVYG